MIELLVLRDLHGVEEIEEALARLLASDRAAAAAATAAAPPVALCLLGDGLHGEVLAGQPVDLAALGVVKRALACEAQPLIMIVY